MKTKRLHQVSGGRRVIPALVFVEAKLAGAGREISMRSSGFRLPPATKLTPEGQIDAWAGPKLV